MVLVPGDFLVGAVLNLRPELFKVAIADVPFVDVLTTMLDDSLPLTTSEYNEWGDPDNKTYYQYIKSYSPYDNVKAQDYPPLLISTGIHDQRVTYWEPVKWLNKIRSLNTSTHQQILKINWDAGHIGASGRYKYLNEIADHYAYVLDIFRKNKT